MTHKELIHFEGILEFEMKYFILDMKIHGPRDIDTAKYFDDYFRAASRAFYRDMRRRVSAGAEGDWYDQKTLDILCRCAKCISQFDEQEIIGPWRSLLGYCKRWAYFYMICFPKLEVKYSWI